MTVKTVKPCFAVCANVLFYLFFDTIFSKILFLNSDNIETKPGPRKSSPIKFCHWNINGLAAHDFISTFNFDILCLSETLLGDK